MILDFFKKRETPKAQKGAIVTIKPQNYAGAGNNNLTYNWTSYKYTSDQIIEKVLRTMHE